MSLVVGVENPQSAEVQVLLASHLAFCREASPPEHVHALELDALVDPAVTLFGARREGRLVGIGALKRLDRSHAEIKSMHTDRGDRRQGVGRTLVEHLLSVAAEQGYRRVSLETGSMAEFEAARTLYSSMGFRRCDPFGEYAANPYSTCMTMDIPPVTADHAHRHPPAP